ncbi:DNA mismatch repair protein Msh6-like [Trichogramma pretiosum]|uniref:DNA mismatch repair protein Msh6-like n=1 Tax=Trichogramma pretiosum TaxID=7493 RepID=UPI0006C9D631|nr:DNA mismatch repair protein Msh6-like [Trichogramma pretiosum]
MPRKASTSVMKDEIPSRGKRITRASSKPLSETSKTKEEINEVIKKPRIVAKNGIKNKTRELKTDIDKTSKEQVKKTAKGSNKKTKTDTLERANCPGKSKTNKTKGKENIINQNKKRTRQDSEGDKSEDYENAEKVEPAKSNPIKKRRLIIPDFECSDGSEDEYKPDSDLSDEESDDNFAVESESSLEEMSESDFSDNNESEEDNLPTKKVSKNKTSNAKSSSHKPKKACATKSLRSKTAKVTTAKSKDLPIPETVVEKSASSITWPHLTWEFLQTDHIMDKNKRRPDHPEYDPKTLYVPEEFFNKQTATMRQWWSLKSEHLDTLLCFKWGKFYELYHMDAVTAVNAVGLAIHKKDIAQAGFPEKAYCRFAGGLIEQGYKVARIEQTETSEAMNARVANEMKILNTKKVDKVVRREICQISTKGTRVFTQLDEPTRNPAASFLLSLYEKKDQRNSTIQYGVCFVDASIGHFYLGQFQDDQCNSRLLTLLAHSPPAQIVFERGNLSSATLKILEHLAPNVLKEGLLKENQFWTPPMVLKCLQEEEYFKNDEDSSFSWPDGLKSFIIEDNSEKAVVSEGKELALNALGGCVYLLRRYKLDYQVLSQRNFHSYIPPDFTCDSKSTETRFAQNMVLDAMTINNLRILGNDGSLIDTLDTCCTPFGKRLLKEWICKPSCQKLVIKKRQNAIGQLLDNLDVIKTARSMLSELSDLERLLSKIHVQGNAAIKKNHPDGRAILCETQHYTKKAIKEFIEVLSEFEKILLITDLFTKFNDRLIQECTHFQPAGDFPDYRELLKHFKDSFDHDEALESGIIIPKKGVDKDYDATVKIFDQIDKEVDDYVEAQKIYFKGSVKLVGSEGKRYQIEIAESLFKEADTERYKVMDAKKGKIRFYTTEAEELLERKIQAEELQDVALRDINRRIFGKFSKHYHEWSKAVHNIAVLDCLISLAEYARSNDTCIPEIYDDTDNKGSLIEIRDGRHPCISLDNYISNDTLMSTDGVASLIILTGPNMGGKSTLMRQVGLITVMAQIGCYVPAAECKLTLVDRIFTRLGANDDIMSGQSTFLVELKETAVILKHATKYSLVLLDELGRGTSTYDGTAIAASVVEALTKTNCRTLFSTHYHSLVEDYRANNNVSLAHMACIVENENEDQACELNVTFLYKLTEGSSPKSYGFNAARLAGVPANIINRAHKLASKLEAEVNLRHAFTALCKLSDKTAFKPLIHKGIQILSKC